MQPQKKYDYFEAKIHRAEQVLELSSLSEFVRYVQMNHLRHILIARGLKRVEPAFAVTNKGALYVCHTEGYRTLEDYQASESSGFKSAVTYYAALENNCHTAAEYEMYTLAGVTDGSVFSDMKQKGFADGYSMFRQIRSVNKDLPKLETINNVKELYEFSLAKKFTDFNHFLKVWEAGFTDPLEYQLAIERGLSNATDYKLFNRGGFRNIEEFKLARSTEISSYAELSLYINLISSDYPDAVLDERLLLSILSKLENGIDTPFKKLYDFYLKTEEAYQQPDGQGNKKLPPWFTKNLKVEEDFKNYLVQSDFVKRFGTYNAEKEIFETVHIARRKVVVDGSNVAYNSSLSEKGKHQPHLKNILILIKKLKQEYKFEDIHVIADSTLLPRVKDKEVLKEIKNLCRFSESPPGTPADLYLIHAVQRDHCLLVTNDTFKDWKLNDRWIEDNIDFYRLPFVLNEQRVMIPHMERFGE